MQKEKSTGKRVAVNTNSDPFFHRGQTGKVTEEPDGGILFVEMDGYFDRTNKPQAFPFALSELYFPDDKQGYNQKCFKQI